MISLFKPTALILLVALTACNKSAVQSADQNTIRNTASGQKSAISAVKNGYRIDTSIILANENKKALVALLNKESLSEKQTFQQLPDFIKSFLNSVTAGHNFWIANPGEEWQSGMILPLEQCHVKQYDNFLKDTVVIPKLIPKNVPPRQLMYLGLGEEIAVLAYYTGGVNQSQQVSVIKFKGQQITDFWFDRLPANIKKEEILKYIRNNNERSRSC